MHGCSLEADPFFSSRLNSFSNLNVFSGTMGIDAEDILVCLWKFIRFFVDTTYVCAQKHPYVSSTLFLVFLCYVFFDLLLHHLPLLVFLAVLLRIFWSSEGQESSTGHVHGDENPDPVADKKREIETSSYRRQKSRRTCFSKHRSLIVSPEIDAKFGVDSIESDATFVVVPSEDEEKLDIVYPKHDAKLDVVPEERESETNRADGDGDREQLERAVGFPASKSDDEDDEEIGDNHAVEWNADDQRNLDDLGVSEIERNRRLESLIAKRRARKLAKPRGGSGGRSPEIAVAVAPILVAKEARPAIRAEGSRTPGSAPSVLVGNNKNPFDIPYDPTEEKPDLTADSFQEEFTAANQKDGVSYCRHESFCWAGFGFEPEKGFFRPSGNDAVIEQLLGPTKPPIARMPFITESESQRQTQSLDTETSLDSATTTNDTVVSEQDPPNDTNNSDATEIETEPSITEGSETNSLYSLEVSNRSIEGISTAEAQDDTSPTANDRADGEPPFFGENIASHTPSYSIASDMQVEVSEIDSAPLTIGNVSPIDGDSLSFDEELERGHLNYDIESFDDDEDIDRATSGERKQKSAMRFAEELSSHPFFESAYKASKGTRGSGSENRGRQDDSEEATDNMSILSEETDSGPNVHIEQAITTEDTDLSNTNSESESTREASSSMEEAIDSQRHERSSRVDPNSPGSKFDQLVTRQESFLVNKSSPSSPMCTPVGCVPVNYAFSSDSDRWITIDATIDRGLVDEQPANENSETLEEPSALCNICEEPSIGLNITESMSEDKQAKDESGSTTDNGDEGKATQLESASESSQ